MSRRHIIKEFQVLTNSDTTSDPQSTPSDISSVDFITYKAVIDNTVNAIARIYVCNKPIFDPSSLIELNFGSAMPMVGATETDYLFHIDNRGFKWMVLDIEDNGGAGNINAWVNGISRGA